MLLYEGKAKIIYKTDNENEVRINFKDDTTAFNGIKKAQITDKGRLNLAISNHIYAYLKANGIKTHLVKTIDENNIICQKCDVVMLEFICRNKVMGSIKKRLGFTDEILLDNPVLEICYKNDDLGDPLINDHHAFLLNICNREELDYMYDQTLKINELLKKLFLEIGLKLADFKIEFGRNIDGEIILVDEISPDSCRLIDINTQKQLDKDLFRLDTGDIKVAYQEILDRMDDNVRS